MRAECLFDVAHAAAAADAKEESFVDPSQPNELESDFKQFERCAKDAEIYI